jgi:P4 family phage/plasmid primase-like protien
MPDIQKLYSIYAANTARFPALYAELASQLGVSPESVTAIGAGFLPVDDKGNWAWVFPERDAKGKVIGISKRLQSGAKYMVTDSKRGLMYAVNRDTAEYERNQFVRVSTDYPCILCGKPDGCLYPEGEYENPNAVVCVHIATGAAKTLELGHLHILDPARQKLHMQNYSLLMPSEHPVLIVEGASDVCAAYDLGFVAIGKPSAASKSKELPKLLTGRDVVVMGENDAGAGRAGMESTVDALQSTCTNLTKLMPPTGVKDLRHWVENGLTQAELLSYIEDKGDKAPQDMDALSDIDTAERFVAEHRDKIRFNRTSGKWMNYDGQRWSYNTGEDETTRCYIKTTKTLWAEALACKDPDEKKRLSRGAQHAQSANGRRGALSYVKSMMPISSGQEDYNKDDYLFNCLDCTIDLRTGEPRPHDPADMITLLAPVNYYYTGRPIQPRLWFNSMDRWHSGEEDTIDYLQRFTGMCCTGDISSRVFSIFHGEGKNGKSVFLDTLRGMLGDYAGSTARTLLTASRNREHSTEIADLYGKRLSIASETKEGDKLRAELVKSLTGDKYQKARFMHKDFFEFVQTAKVVLMTNHLLAVNDTGDAIWDRFHYVKWAVKIPKVEWDTHLTEKLKEEWTGILRWAIEGCLKWQEDGALIPTEAICRHTEEYRNEQDPMPEFVQHCVESDETGPGVPVDFLYHLWRCWCSRDGSKPGKKNAFLRALLAACEEVIIEEGDEGAGQVVVGIKTTDRAVQIESEGV